MCSVAVALDRHLGSLPFKTRRQRFELELLVILESEQGRGREIVITYSRDNNTSSYLPEVFPIIIFIHFPNLVSKFVALVESKHDDTTGFPGDRWELAIVLIVPSLLPKSKLS